MKKEFWKNWSELIVYLILVFICAILVLTFSILFINNADVLYGIIFSAIMLIIGIACIFLQKRILTKIIFSNQGIEIKRFGKQIGFINWETLTDIQYVIHGRIGYLSFIVKDSQLEVALTKKIYNAIMAICPYPNIKAHLNNMEELKSFHKNK